LPDADVIAFSFGIPYGHMLGHRGLTHSLAFAVVLGLVVVVLAFRGVPRFSKVWWGLVLYFAVVTASHGVLDAFTNGGKGVAFFAPFDNARHFFPWQPLRVSPIGVERFFTTRGLETLLSEMKWIWIPSALCILAGQVFKRRRKNAGAPQVNGPGLSDAD
jgi:inner membrane protein